MFKITLSDDTVLENIGINGTTLISYEPLDVDVLNNNLSPVSFEWIGEKPELEKMYIESMEGSHSHMKFENISSSIVDGEHWFALIDIPESELRYAEIRSNIDYLAMMTEVEL